MDQQEKLLDQISAVHQGNQRIEEMLGHAALSKRGLGAVLSDFLASKIGPSDLAHEKRALKEDLISALYTNNESHATNHVVLPSITPDREEHLRTVFSDRLSYRGINEREVRIERAYEKTFQWIFKNNTPQQKRWSNFKDWLESDEKLYWITGKAGSGKSTLIKYVCQKDEHETLGASSSTNDEVHIMKYESRCAKHLRVWAGDFPFISATFFFWNSGVELQMSQRGLLRSLLYQIMREVPEIISTVSPTRWEALCLFNDDRREFMEPELRQMLRTATMEISKTMKVCLFVDGLDEFEGPHDDLICLFRDLIANPNIKICVSSRPWIVFEDAFKHLPSMMLQELTYNDIKYYVTENMQNDSRFIQLRRREPQYADQLIENIVAKASGVFLWVHVVVASLLAGMGLGDRVSDLQKRLDLLPPELEMLYDKIFQSLDPFYLEHAAQLFKLVEQSHDPPPLLLLSFADEDDLESTLKRPVGPMSQDEVSIRAETMRNRLNSRCKGFLEVGSASIASRHGTEETVQYLHRTVKDYVESEEAQRTLGAALDSSFDPHHKLCVGSLAYLKVIEEGQDPLANGTFWVRVRRCLFAADRIKPSNRPDLVPLLDELDSTGRILAKRISKYVASWPRFEPNKGELLVSLLENGQWVASHPHLTKWPAFGANYLSLIVRYGIVDYVEARANRGCLVQHFRSGIWPLLIDALNVDLRDAIGFADTVPNIEMIACLLKKGADPNYSLFGIDGMTQPSIWLQTVRYILGDFDGLTLKSPWEEIATLMIRHGAKADNDMVHMIIDDKRKLANVQKLITPDPFPYWREVTLFNKFANMQRRTAPGWSSWYPWSRKGI